MGCDIHGFTEVKRKGKWEKIDLVVFDYRSYTLFAFLADVRNYDHCEPICQPKGLPKDSEWLNSPTKYSMGDRSYWTEEPVKIETNYDDVLHDMNYHSIGYLTLKELLDYDYDKKFWNRRISKQIGINCWNGAAIAEEGEGEILSYRDNLGKNYFDEIEKLKSLGKPEDVRIIFWFDN